MKNVFEGMTEAEFEIWISARFSQEYAAIAKMKAEFDAHKALLTQNSAENQELLEMFRSAKIFFKVMGHIGAAAVWVGKIAVAVGILWALWKFAVWEAVRQGMGGGK